MAEATQYTFSWPEVTEMLIKKQDIHEGEWMTAVQFAIAGGVIGQGPTPADAKPGVMVFANGLQLVRAEPNAPPHLVVDAGKVNPKS